MTELIVRRLLVDMEQPILRHWCNEDPFRSAFFNALSMSFPVGEQFFIDSVRGGLKLLPIEVQEKYAKEVRGFIGQEATHRRLHALYNKHLDNLGLVNKWELRLKERQKQLQDVHIRHWLAITAANEHFTAIIAGWLLRNPEILGQQDERLATLWLWHSAEESEHRSTAYDLYRALGGNDEWRLRWFRRVTLGFIVDVLRQTFLNLHKDKTLWRWSTVSSSVSFLFGRKGVARQIFVPWKEYLRADFHPANQDDSYSQNWFEANQLKYSRVDFNSISENQSSKEY